MNRDIFRSFSYIVTKVFHIRKINQDKNDKYYEVKEKNKENDLEPFDHKKLINIPSFS